MIQKKISFFQLTQIADSGQCFRMVPYQNSGNAYVLISGDHILRAAQSGDMVDFFCPEAELPFWEQYFDLDTDYGAFFAAIDRADSYLARAADFGSGIRILRQEPWEMIITFIISQQKTIPAIRQAVEALSRQYGTRLSIPAEAELSGELPVSPTDAGRLRTPELLYSGEFYAFPTPEQLSRASLEDLLGLKLGYRAKYIKRVCEDACAGRLELSLLAAMSYGDAMNYLTGFYGIGEKVANCICLFGLHHIDAFPIDTWIKKILDREYASKSRLPEDMPQSRFYETLVKEHFSRYQGFAGVLQQYMFYYEREAGKFSKSLTLGGTKNC